MDVVTLVARLRATAESHGCVGFGVTGAEPFPDVEAEMRARLAVGAVDRVRFTYRDPRRATDPRATAPWAERIVVLAHPAPAAAPAPAPGAARVARYAVVDGYRPLREALGELTATLRAAGYRAEVRCDDSRLVDRAAAVRAGVGWWGRSTMVLVPGYGPWVLLGSVVTDAPLPVHGPMERSCGRCIACVPACPTGALDGEGGLDARRCLAWILQAPGPIPRHLRVAVGDRLYGCDDCLDACPPGRRRPSTVRRGLDPVVVLGASDAELLARFGHWYLPGRRPRVIRRNALVVLANLGGPVEVAIGHLAHPDALLRRHAAWAVGRLGGRFAGAALRAALRREPDAEVRREIVASLGSSSPPETLDSPPSGGPLGDRPALR